MNRFLLRAIELAVENVRASRGGPFGAVVVHQGEIVAEGVNEVTLTNDPTAHAEVVAIRRACQSLAHFSLKGCEMFTSCEPCPMCLGAIYWAWLDRVYFSAIAAEAADAGFDDSRLYQEVRLPPSERSIAMVPMLRDWALFPFEEWRRSTTKIQY